MHWKEFEVIVFVKPRTLKVIKAQAGKARQGQGVKHELLERAFAFCIGLIVQDMDHAVSDLQKIDMAGYWTVGGESTGMFASVAGGVGSEAAGVWSVEGGGVGSLGP